MIFGMKQIKLKLSLELARVITDVLKSEEEQNLLVINNY
jgi:hypothetical protein